MPATGAFARTARGLIGRLAGDCAGNTLVLVGAAIFPILAMVGGGIDVGRGYMSENRLQQACDAGVLAARKRLGSQAVVDGVIPKDVGIAGQRFFDINFGEGDYGTENRQFSMELEDDYSVAGTASVTVPTTIMAIFGFKELKVDTECRASLNFANTDVMMVLDTTGSMNQTNPGDTLSRIDALKAAVISFYKQLEASKKTGARVRYGFVPYAANVNVGELLEDDWVVDKWKYQSRELVGSGNAGGTVSYFTAVSTVSGTQAESRDSTYAATFTEGLGYSCPTRPANTVTSTTKLTNTVNETVPGPPAGTRTIKTYQRTRNGNQYSVALKGTTCAVSKVTYSSYIDTYKSISEPSLGSGSQWKYAAIERDTSAWRSDSNGCIEERLTYEIDDYDNVNLSKALDLDIDTVPNAKDPDTQWRPQYPQIIYARSLKWDGSGSFQTNPDVTSSEYVAPWGMGLGGCPSKAAKLQEWDLGSISSYVSGLTPGGSTYHDIGMIWGGRLLSPTGLFADDNADKAGSPTARNLIFFTDGQTSPLDVNYSSYGIEPVDRRRWQVGASLSLKNTIEARFAFVCKEVKKRNIKVWLIAFGTEVNPVMAECAGPGQYFSAHDADQLGAAFAKIAQNIGDLRITR